MKTVRSHPPEIDEVRAAVREACASRSVIRVQLFGSVARGEAHADSDVDLLVEFAPPAEAGLFEMGGFKEELEERLGCRVDLLSPAAVAQSRNALRRQAILIQALTLYER